MRTRSIVTIDRSRMCGAGLVLGFGRGLVFIDFGIGTSITRSMRECMDDLCFMVYDRNGAVKVGSCRCKWPRIDFCTSYDALF